MRVLGVDRSSWLGLAVVCRACAHISHWERARVAACSAEVLGDLNLVRLDHSDWVRH